MNNAKASASSPSIALKIPDFNFNSPRPDSVSKATFDNAD